MTDTTTTDGITVSKSTPRSGLAIGVPSSGRPCPVQWAVALATMSYPVNTNLSWIHVIGESIDDARERIVEEAQKAGVKYLWFVDDDTVPPIDAARQLIYILDQEAAAGSKVMVAGGIYCAKQTPPTPLVFESSGSGPKWDWKVGDVFDVWGIGTGCMMINMEIFNHLEKPFFKTTSEVHLVETDDMYFCAKVNKAGFKIKAHGGILCSHWDSKEGVIYTLPKNSYPNQP
jgi:hypothetical protein